MARGGAPPVAAPGPEVAAVPGGRPRVGSAGREALAAASLDGSAVRPAPPTEGVLGFPRISLNFLIFQAF